MMHKASRKTICHKDNESGRYLECEQWDDWTVSISSRLQNAIFWSCVIPYQQNDVCRLITRSDRTFRELLIQNCIYFYHFFSNLHITIYQHLHLECLEFILRIYQADLNMYCILPEKWSVRPCVTNCSFFAILYISSLSFYFYSPANAIYWL